MNDLRIKPPYWIDPLAQTIRIILLVALPIIVGCGIILFQTYTYLRFSIWTPVSILDMAALFYDHEWLSNPTDWHGLHSLLNTIPASLSLLIFAYFMLPDDN